MTSRWSSRARRAGSGWSSSFATRSGAGRWSSRRARGRPGRSGSQDDLARTELREETGLSAGRLTWLGHLLTAPGFCSQEFDVYLAEELTPGPTDREATEQDMTHRLVGFAEFRAGVASGAIADSATLAAYSLLTLARDGAGTGR